MGADRWWTWPAATGAAVLAGVLLVVGAWGASGGWAPPPRLVPVASPDPSSGTAPPASSTTPSTAAPSTAGPATAGTDAGAEVGEPPAAHPVPTPPPPTPGQPRVGDCIELGAAPVGVVPCDAEHHLEVTALVDPAGVYAGMPSASQWQALLALRCPRLSTDYLAGRLDPHGRLVLRVAAPDEVDWQDGDRLGECLVGVGSDDGGGPSTVTGRAATLDQTPPWTAGDCLVTVPGTDLPPRRVVCDTDHQLEVTGRLEVGAAADPYPDETVWRTLAGGCAAAAEAHAGRALTAPRAVPLAPAVVRLPLESWLAGRRTTFCAVAEIDAAAQPVTRRAPLRG